MSHHNKRKIKASTAFFMVCVFVVTIGLGMYIAFGMNVQHASGAVSVEYSANNVHATVSAYYQICGDNTTYAMTRGGETSTTFTASQNTTTATFSAGNISLSSDRTYILFTFTFTNLAPRNDVSQGYDVKVTLHDNCTKTNISTYYMATSTTPTGTLASNYATMSTQGLTSGLDSFYVPAQRTMYVKILAEITDLDYSATYSSSGANKLSWDLDHVDLKDGSDSEWVINEENVLTAYNGDENVLTIPNSVTSIAPSVFENKTSITSVTIPSTIISIGDRAFYGCSGITSMTINCPSTATVGEYSLFGVDVDSITISNRDILKGTHLAIGNYPQAYVGNTLNSTLESLYNGGTLQTGLTATGDSYKVSSTASTSSSVNQTYATVVEYAYNGEKYCRLASAKPHSTNNGFSTGDSIVSGRTYWFKVEPISVKVMNTTSSTDSTKLTVMADAVICTHRYNKTVVAWKDNPEVRTYLNGGTVNGTSVSFYTESGLNNVNAVVSTTIKNQSIGGYASETSGAEYNTTDYVWCPSFWEMTQSSNGYATNDGTYDTARYKKGTDLAKATSLSCNTSSAYLGNGTYWTRSAYPSNVYYVFYYGNVRYGVPYTYILGVAPCFALSL